MEPLAVAPQLGSGLAHLWRPRWGRLVPEGLVLGLERRNPRARLRVAHEDLVGWARPWSGIARLGRLGRD